VQRHHPKPVERRGIGHRALAEEPTRDYKNVHTDVQRLKEIGLVERSEDDNVEVPWGTIEASLHLAE
jgi:predicted transcriptional regulator